MSRDFKESEFGSRGASNQFKQAGKIFEKIQREKISKRNEQIEKVRNKCLEARLIQKNEEREFFKNSIMMEEIKEDKENQKNGNLSKQSPDQNEFMDNEYSIFNQSGSISFDDIDQEGTPFFPFSLDDYCREQEALQKKEDFFMPAPFNTANDSVLDDYWALLLGTPDKVIEQDHPSNEIEVEECRNYQIWPAPSKIKGPVHSQSKNECLTKIEEELNFAYSNLGISQKVALEKSFPRMSWLADTEERDSPRNRLGGEDFPGSGFSTMGSTFLGSLSLAEKDPKNTEKFKQLSVKRDQNLIL